MNKLKSLLKILVIFFKEKVLRSLVAGGIIMANAKVISTIIQESMNAIKHHPKVLRPIGVTIFGCLASISVGALWTCLIVADDNLKNMEA